MGGGPVLEDMFVPFNWPVAQMFDQLLFTTALSPGCYGSNVQSPLVEFITAPQGWPSCSSCEAVAKNDPVQHTEPLPKQVKEIPMRVKDASVRTGGTKHSEFQSAEVEKRGRLQSEGAENESRVEPEEEEEKKGGVRPEVAEELLELVKQNRFQSEDVEKTGVFQLDGGYEKQGGAQPDEVEKEGRFQAEAVDEQEGEFQPEPVEEKEVGSDEETRAATVVQAMYRAHLVRMTRPLVQLRSIAAIEAKLTRLKEQTGSRAFKDELMKKKSMAKVGFEEDTLALLIELDKIQGSHPLVRQIRKSVVREIIDLQETVDTFLAGHKPY